MSDRRETPEQERRNGGLQSPSLHGAQGFALLSEILENSGRYRFAYGNLNEAASAFDALAAAA